MIVGTGEQGLEVLEESHSLSLAAGGSLISLSTLFKCHHGHVEKLSLTPKPK